MVAGGNIDRCKWLETVGCITELSGRRTWGPVVVGFILFNIMESLSRM